MSVFKLWKHFQQQRERKRETEREKKREDGRMVSKREKKVTTQEGE